MSTFLMPTMIEIWERCASVGMLGKSAAPYDQDFYDVGALEDTEREQAMALLAEQKAVEGSIFLVFPKDGFDLYPGQPRGRMKDFCCAPGLHGIKRAEAIVNQFEAFLDDQPKVVVKTFVIPGCGSSPLGAAALGKTVANTIGQPVAVVVAGEGAFDGTMEVVSGGMIIGPASRFLNACDRILELVTMANPIAMTWAKMYARSVCEAMDEAATLFALLRTRLLETKDEKLCLNGCQDRRIEMIVSHSKGNWNVLAALLRFELEFASELEQNPEDVGGGALEGKRIDVVTFGNPVDLPNMSDVMRKLFHYHQYVGGSDQLAAMNAPTALLAQMLMQGKIHPNMPMNPAEDPDLRVFVGCHHNLIPSREGHMPIEQILPAIRERRLLH